MIYVYIREYLYTDMQILMYISIYLYRRSLQIYSEFVPDVNTELNQITVLTQIYFENFFAINILKYY